MYNNNIPIRECVCVCELFGTIEFTPPQTHLYVGLLFMALWQSSFKATVRETKNWSMLALRDQVLSCQKHLNGAGRMAFAEDQCSISSSHMVTHNHLRI